MRVQSARGFTLVELMIVIALIAVIAAIAIPNLIEARKNANESASIGALKAILTAEILFYTRDPDFDGADYALTLGELSTYKLIDPELGSTTKQGYRYEIHDATAHPYDWHAHSYPLVPGRSGERYFYIDETGVIRFKRTGEANLVDPEIN